MSIDSANAAASGRIHCDLCDYHHERTHRDGLVVRHNAEWVTRSLARMARQARALQRAHPYSRNRIILLAELEELEMRNDRDAAVAIEITEPGGVTTRGLLVGRTTSRTDTL